MADEPALITELRKQAKAEDWTKVFGPPEDEEKEN